MNVVVLFDIERYYSLFNNKTPLQELSSFCSAFYFDVIFIRNFVLIYFLHQASEAWMEWIIKKRKAFDQRGDMAIAAWAEQQQRELNLRARRLARSKVSSHFLDVTCEVHQYLSYKRF